MNTKEKGFTLIELLVVLALIAILVTILIVVLKPGTIFMKGRDAQRQGDLRNLSIAVDAYLTESAANPNAVPWPTTTSRPCSNVYFSIATTVIPTGWPSTSTVGASAITGVTGTASTTLDGTGWVPLNFTLVPVVNFNQLPIDPRNGQLGTIGTTTIVFAYAFSCNNNFDYEFLTKLEGGTSTMANDGGNSNCTTDSVNCLYEYGPGRNKTTDIY